MRGRGLGLSARWTRGRGQRRHPRAAPSGRASLECWFHPQFEPLERRYVLATVTGHFLFYDQSAFDGGIAGVSPLDDSAIPNKSAYVPNGSTALIDSLSNYTRGINGIMVDLSGAGDHAAITKDDFVFEVGNGSGPWTAAPDPSGVAVRLGEGANSSDRVEITWTSGSIVDTWLRVRVLPTEHTGLDATDVFFWGSLRGETASVTPGGTFARIFGSDAAAIVANGTSVNVGINNFLDVDHNNVVIAAGDRAALLPLGTGLLSRISFELSAPTITAGLANDTAPDNETNSDGITSDPTVAGTVLTLHGLTGFWGGLDAGSATTDISAAVQPAGDFTLSPSVLDTINGGPLADGCTCCTCEPRTSTDWSDCSTCHSR